MPKLQETEWGKLEAQLENLRLSEKSPQVSCYRGYKKGIWTPNPWEELISVI